MLTNVTVSFNVKQNISLGTIDLKLSENVFSFSRLQNLSLNLIPKDSSAPARTHFSIFSTLSTSQTTSTLSQPFPSFSSHPDSVGETVA